MERGRRTRLAGQPELSRPIHRKRVPAIPGLGKLTRSELGVDFRFEPSVQAAPGRPVNGAGRLAQCLGCPQQAGGAPFAAVGVRDAREAPQGVRQKLRIAERQGKVDAALEAMRSTDEITDREVHKAEADQCLSRAASV